MQPYPDRAVHSGRRLYYPGLAGVASAGQGKDWLGIEELLAAEGEEALVVEVEVGSGDEESAVGLAEEDEAAARDGHSAEKRLQGQTMA